MIRQYAARFGLWPFTLAASAAGAIVNLLPLQLTPDSYLAMGNFAFILVAFRAGAVQSLVSAVLATLPLAISTQQVDLPLIHGLEAMVVCALRQRGLRPLYGAAAFWLVLGLPLSAAEIALPHSSGFQYALFECLHKTFNALLCASLACILVLLTPGRWLPGNGAPGNGRRPSIHGEVVYVAVLITALTLAATILLSTRAVVEEHQDMLHHSLDESSRLLGQQVEAHLREHQGAIKTLADALSSEEQTREELGHTLAAYRETFPGFLTMLITDPRGNLIASAPRLPSQADGAPLSVADRDYFREPMADGGAFISGVFRGRGFGSDTIVAVSALYYDSAGKPAGIVEGSLDLRVFAKSASSSILGYKVDGMLVDTGRRVIHASAGLGFRPLEAAENRIDLFPQSGLAMLRDESDRGHGSRHVYSRNLLSNGWCLFAMVSYDSVREAIARHYALGFAMFIVAVVLAGVLAAKAASRVTAPLEQMARGLAQADGGAPDSADDEPQHAVEIVTVKDALRRSLARIREHEAELQQQVLARTRELQEANEQLRSLATRDALTGIQNRRALEDKFVVLSALAARMGTNLAVILVDIDHFKRFNDTHGHLSGDNCIKSVARALEQEFARSSDIVARYGGEEFVIVASNIPVETLRLKLERLRRSIANLDVVTESGASVQITSSFGAVIADAGQDSLLKDWLRKADANLYQAKRDGRNRVVLQQLDEAGADRHRARQEPGKAEAPVLAVVGAAPARSA